MTHAYELTKTEAGNTEVVCTGPDCGYQGAYPDAVAVSAFIQIHDRFHAVERNAYLPHQGDIDAWLWGPGAGRTDIWEPSAEERDGHVAIPLGYVILEDVLARVAGHQCPALRRAKGFEVPLEELTLRILDVNGKASDHPLTPEQIIDRPCLTDEVLVDERVDTAWFVRRLDGVPSSV